MTADVSLAERAYREIRRSIITLELRPGQAINEDDLMGELGIGRTPIREAIKRLAQESLIEIYPRRGTFVSDVQITDLAAISEVRQQLEGYAAGLAARRVDPEVRDRIDELLAETEGVKAMATNELMDLDASVHDLVYEAAKNRFLRETLAGYLGLSQRIWHVARDRLPAEQSEVWNPRELLLAIRKGDETRARDIAARHVSDFEREMRSAFWADEPGVT
ncbi:MAG: GntR family transcriptional regulator [Solirubrobacterales bacterium]|nr:GntR family transcriptional regulator [Solirubrobacterales bacterium]